MWYQLPKRDIEKVARKLYEIGIGTPGSYHEENVRGVSLENDHVKIVFGMMRDNDSRDPFLAANAYIDGVQVPCDLTGGPIWSRTPEAGIEEHRLGTLAYYKANVRQVLDEFEWSYMYYAKPYDVFSDPEMQKYI